MALGCSRRNSHIQLWQWRICWLGYSTADSAADVIAPQLLASLSMATTAASLSWRKIWTTTASTDTSAPAKWKGTRLEDEELAELARSYKKLKDQAKIMEGKTD